jgi:uncharacterized protein (DUF2225 family)
MRTKMGWLTLALFLVTTGALVATTWAPTDVQCPVCHTKNSFNSIMSYGTYIYGWPSKFQNIFWPATDGSSLYTCKHCYFTTFMWDFDKLPTAKVGEVQRVLQSVTLEAKNEQYTSIPMSKRLAIAEKVYSVLDKDDHFWSWFYRVEGYHFAREKKPDMARAARAKALEYARKLLDDRANSGKRKELLLTTGAMHHFLGDDAAAQNDFQDALKAGFEDSKLTPEQNKNAGANLDALLKEYLEQLRKKTVPNDDGSDSHSQ